MTLPLSLVVALRDPAYAGDLLGRFRLFTRALLHGATRHGLRGELLVVEWNPPEDRATFHRTWRPELPLGELGVRFLVVPPRVHASLPNADRIPIHEYIAKNVGLRRAAGRHVLATNPDLLFSDELIAFLAAGRFSHDTYYRIDREDVGRPIPSDLDVAGQLAFCDRNVTRVHTRIGSLDVHPEARLRDAIVDRLRRLEVAHAYLRFRLGRSLPRLRSRSLEGRVAYPADGLHRNAAGDFLLMSRDAWGRLGGYPELTTHAHIDSILVWVADSAGLEQEILAPPRRLYHQQHGRSEHRTMPKTDWRPWYDRYQQAKARGEPILVNGETWGLPDEAFEEWIVPAGSAAGTEPERAS